MVPDAACPVLFVGEGALSNMPGRVTLQAKMSSPGSSETMRLSTEQVEAINRAIADPRRFEMLQQIAKEPALMCSALNAQECLSPATISHHLKELQTAGLLEMIREGRTVRMSLRRDVWTAYLQQLAAL